jgi:class 3 adenylate cyclase
MSELTQIDDQIAAGRAALAEHRWEEGYQLLRAADAESPLGAQDLEALVWAAYWTDDIAQVVPLLERAYAANLDDGNKGRAAFLATQLAHEYGSVRQQKGLGNAWMARATRLLENESEGPEHGYYALQRGLEALGRNDFVEMEAQGALAERIGREHGDRALELRGQQRRAVALIYRGEVDEGKLLLNEVHAAAYEGGLHPYDTLVIYCNAIGTCRDVADFDEASQWTERAQLFCDENAVAPFPGMCRINRAEVMRHEGKLVDAEAAATEASRLLEGWAPRLAAAAYVEVGEVRLRLGELAKAEEAFDQADDLGRDPEPGRSLLLLARGKPAAALASIRRALAEDPPPLARARLLPPLVEIAVAAGEVDEAAPAADELRDIAARYDTASLHAASCLAVGSVTLARGDAAGAVRPLRQALRRWQETNARYEAARTRVVLARAYAESGDDEGAMHELGRAGSIFDQLGARLDAQRVDALLGREAGQRVTMSFAFTDIVDSTRHLEHHGDVHWEKLMRRHDELVRERVEASGGRVIDHTGDGFFLAFDKIDDAVDAAIAVQRAAAEHLPFDLRIGIHTSEATYVGDDYRGKGVHTAARIGAVARGEEILVSASSLAASLDVRRGDPRSEQLKGLAEPVEVVPVAWR